MKDIVCGWDIGGAHLKAARIEHGRVTAVRQIACPLWLGEDRLRMAFAEIGDIARDAAVHAITMTGELAENFASRSDGVARIVSLCRDSLSGRIAIYTMDAGFVDCDDAQRHWEGAASANWHATAVHAARIIPDAVLIDVGSTTTDIVPIEAGQVKTHGNTDAARMLAGELVYTGVVRTSLMALAGKVPLRGTWQPLMAENFAASADIYRRTRELDERDDVYPASDGRGKSADECRARIARMFGLDGADLDPQAIDTAAAYFRERQIRLLHDATFQVLSAQPLSPEAPVICAGAGHFLARQLASRMHRTVVDFGDLAGGAGEIGRLARLCAPAVAVALLASP